MKKPHRQTRRSGLTLVELVAVIAVTGVIFTIMTRVIHAMVRQQATATRQIATNQSRRRLRAQFQRDVRAATESQVSADKIQLTLPDEIDILWQRDQEFLVRTHQRNGQIRREHYNVLAEQQYAFESEYLTPKVQIVTIRFYERDVERQPDSRYVATTPPSQINAELGRDHRWSSHEHENKKQRLGQTDDQDSDTGD